MAWFVADEWSIQLAAGTAGQRIVNIAHIIGSYECIKQSDWCIRINGMAWLFVAACSNGRQNGRSEIMHIHKTMSKLISSLFSWRSHLQSIYINTNSVLSVEYYTSLLANCFSYMTSTFTWVPSRIHLRSPSTIFCHQVTRVKDSNGTWVKSHCDASALNHSILLTVPFEQNELSTESLRNLGKNTTSFSTFFNIS